MTVRTLTPSAPTGALRSPSTLGARVRQLRTAAGLTQDELAGERCSKEYVAEIEIFSDVERAEVLYRMGVCRYKLSSINSALMLLNEAMELASRSGLPCDRLRADILEWRSRCSRRQRDFEAAREDIELALELAQGLEDTLTVAHVMFQASL